MVSVSITNKERKERMRMTLGGIFYSSESCFRSPVDRFLSFHTKVLAIVVSVVPECGRCTSR